MFHLFILCSGFAALVNLAIGYLLYGIGGLNGVFGYTFSVSCAFLSGMGVSFVLNRRFTFDATDRAARTQLPDFLAVSIGGLMLTAGLSNLLVYSHLLVLPLPKAITVAEETTAHSVAVGLTAIYSYFAHKYVSFRKKASGGAALASLETGLQTSGN
ncbi:GtrA family protein [Aestuariicoccus sp. MJ-SS9]|uniref:GtrA family protein n=1 Tax=Aestuariicoccus sp. MJ-SS9 TaxID=3079855 RepID=UPI00290A6B62|nr:GtrA family protein [Aestuariicoccus sp. MJ-SS9]MDU8913264.1 GtrA family protein [Aestuariicoccus sp. MJ-SS9]